jgi:hypothetical protein
VRRFGITDQHFQRRYGQRAEAHAVSGIRSRDRLAESPVPELSGPDVLVQLAGVGDACDLCPASLQGADIGADGCLALTQADEERIRALARVISAGLYEPAFDENSDGEK